MAGALVTGAGGGIGLAIARRVAARGYQVCFSDLDGEAVERAAEGTGARAWARRLDVTDAAECEAAADEVVERSGSLAVWVNNAGILMPGIAYEQSPDLHRAMLEVNAMGTINGTVAAVRRMLGSGGHVVNIVSLAGLIAPPGEVGYAASKHAAIAFSIGTLVDLRRSGVRNVHVSAVCPDGVWSPMLYDRLGDEDTAASFSGVMLLPDQVAEAVERVLEHPRPVVAIPRWRGWLVRLFDALPSVAVRMMPLLVADARRRQARLRKRVQSGEWPPS